MGKRRRGRADSQLADLLKKELARPKPDRERREWLGDSLLHERIFWALATSYLHQERRKKRPEGPSCPDNSASEFSAPSSDWKSLVTNGGNAGPVGRESSGDLAMPPVDMSEARAVRICKKLMDVAVSNANLSAIASELLPKHLGGAPGLIIPGGTAGKGGGTKRRADVVESFIGSLFLGEEAKGRASSVKPANTVLDDLLCRFLDSRSVVALSSSLWAANQCEGTHPHANPRANTFASLRELMEPAEEGSGEEATPRGAGDAEDEGDKEEKAVVLAAAEMGSPRERFSSQLPLPPASQLSSSPSSSAPAPSLSSMPAALEGPKLLPSKHASILATSKTRDISGNNSSSPKNCSTPALSPSPLPPSRLPLRQKRPVERGIPGVKPTVVPANFKVYWKSRGEHRCREEGEGEGGRPSGKLFCKEYGRSLLRAAVSCWLFQGFGASKRTPGPSCLTISRQRCTSKSTLQLVSATIQRLVSGDIISSNETASPGRLLETIGSLGLLAAQDNPSRRFRTGANSDGEDDAEASPSLNTTLLEALAFVSGLCVIGSMSRGSGEMRRTRENVMKALRKTGVPTSGESSSLRRVSQREKLDLPLPPTALMILSAVPWSSTLSAASALLSHRHAHLQRTRSSRNPSRKRRRRHSSSKSLEERGFAISIRKLPGASRSLLKRVCDDPAVLALDRLLRHYAALFESSVPQSSASPNLRMPEEIKDVLEMPLSPGIPVSIGVPGDPPILKVGLPDSFQRKLLHLLGSLYAFPTSSDTLPDQLKNPAADAHLSVHSSTSSLQSTRVSRKAGHLRPRI